MSMLLLRPLAAADEDLYLSLYGDAGTMAWIAPVLTLPQARRSFQAALALPAHPLHGAQRLVGTVDAASVALYACEPDRHGVVDIGVLVLAAARRRGHAQAGLRALIDGTRNAGASHWRMQINRENAPMLRLAAALGFQPAQGGNGGPDWQCWEAHA
ncbi:MAG: GNAT family N-acetyltransferase [Lysobacterales bacterium]